MKAYKKMKYSFLYCIIMITAIMFMLPACILMLFGKPFVFEAGLVLNAVCGWVSVNSIIKIGEMAR